MAKAIALIIDDEPDLCELIAMTLASMEIDCDSAHSVSQAKAKLKQQQYDFCLTDRKLPDGDGIELVEHVQIYYPQTPIAVITAFGNVDSAVLSLKAGAFDYVNKPIDIKALRELVYSALKLSQSDSRAGFAYPTCLMGESTVVRQLREHIMKVAASLAPIHLVGEAGTGKSHIAKFIHQCSARADKPFIKLNCRSSDQKTLERAIFGYKKGSFPDALADTRGALQEANGGTLFLEEIEHIPLVIQMKLLSVIQDKSFAMIGSNRATACDVRWVTANHSALTKAVANGSFRSDLYYRLNVIECQVPALEQRREDLSIITTLIMESLSERYERQITLSHDALERLGQMQFEGNLLELNNVLERAVSLSETGVVQADAIQKNDLLNPDAGIHFINKMDEGDNLETYMDSVERQVIVDALEKTKWNKTQAAKLLGISFRALRYRLKKLELE